MNRLVSEADQARRLVRNCRTRSWFPYLLNKPPYSEYEEALSLYEYLPEPAFSYVLGQRARDLMGEHVLRRCSEVLPSDIEKRDFYDAAGSHHIRFPENTYEKYQAFLEGFG